MKKFLALFLFLSSCSQKTDHQAVSDFALEKYLGKWHEIARYDHSFERGCKDVSALYELRDDGKISVINRCIKNGQEKIARGVAHFAKDSKTAHLKVSFFRPFYGDYKVIYLDENYRNAIIDGGTYDYFWILSRDRKLDGKALDELLERAGEFGYEKEKMIFD